VVQGPTSRILVEIRFRIRISGIPELSSKSHTRKCCIDFVAFARCQHQPRLSVEISDRCHVVAGVAATLLLRRRRRRHGNDHVVRCDVIITVAARDGGRVHCAVSR